MLDEQVRSDAAKEMGRAISLREEARIALSDAVASLSSSLPSLKRVAPPMAGWSLKASKLGTRVDAAYHDRFVAKIRADLRKAAGPTLLEVADIEKPSGRYKTYYVGPGYGRPLLSGRQVLQYSPINLQYISARSLSDPGRYLLHHPHIVFQADGRSEERLAAPVMVEPGRDGWLASGHVGRLAPRDGVDAGWLWGACSTEHVQLQMKALACGSVVDALYVDDLQDVVLPPDGGVDGTTVIAAWKKFSDANEAQANATSLIEDELARLTGESQLSA